MPLSEPQGEVMRIEKAIVRRVEMPLKFRFRTSFGETSLKSFLLVELRSEGESGWGECTAEDGPFFSSETVGTAGEILRRFLLPLVVGRDVEGPEEFQRLAARVRGHRTAKGALDAALWDLAARRAGVSLSKALGGTRDAVEVGVSLGIAPTPGELVANVGKHVAQGYRRIKLKIEPGLDVARLAAVRAAFPGIVLTVDANAAYRLSDWKTLKALDAFHLDYIEQPLSHEDLFQHAELARRIETAICLDESIRSAADAEAAIALGSCRVMNVKVGRVGGLTESLAIEKLAREAGVPVWCGGMLEAGVGRAANVAAASLAGFTKPGDTSSASRYFDDDIVEPSLEAIDGLMPVPAGAGIGVAVRRDVLARVTVAVEEFDA